jgi:hypothetical protein
MSEWLVFNTKLVIFNLYYARILDFNEDNDDNNDVLDQHT